jgi:endonuclease YncB( thermonuclease family)
MRDGVPVYGVILAAIWFAPVPAMAARYIPDCAGGVEISSAKVARVEKNGALILSDGRAVILEGIRLPEESPARDQALAVLREMAQSQPITFTATPPKEDRYDRVRVQAFGQQWFQTVLLEQGLARVAIAPDRNECAPELYEAEQKARAGRLGLWASQTNAPRRAEAVSGTSADAGRFRLVEGWVTHVARAGSRIFIDFGSNGRQSFSAVIQPEDRKAFRGFDLEGLEAHRVRIRGIVQDYRGRPEIALSNPAQIEVLN